MRIDSSLNVLLCGILLLTTASCSSVFRVDPNDPLEVNEEVAVERDPFKNIMYFHGPVISNAADNGSDAPEVEDIELHARTEQNRPTRYFLRITDYYDGDWRGFDQAFDLAGEKFHALAVMHNVNCTLFCGYDEMLDIELSRKYLDDHAHTGITMRLYGPSSAASAPFTLPAGYIQGFLKGSYSD
ncbi:hypothetical protein F6R98_01100 [Candidatus Methylospira mobilis]|uniref:Uncharacterized protein n=1 Tax=Candidatus Methylospira mobilis TaxID=1808979 RepID=A0A5Q0BBS1_9GAMM|nr:hypothetical protein [Candidatus Methylospira mobilis]QFY41393.1 hypothetical protein F6R98_01100 [Candidatus Methylospira mobilis]